MLQKKNYRVILIAVMAMVLAALFALTTFAADVTGGFGTILGVEDGSYEAASVTINATGDGAVIDEENIIDLSTGNSGLAGLYAVRETGAADWNNEYVFVYGDATARTQLGNWAANSSGKLMPTAVQGTEWIPGTWVSAAGSFATSVWGSTANYYPLTANYIASVGNARELYALEHTYEEAVETLYLTNNYGYSSLVTYYDKHYNYTDTEVPRVDEEGNPVYEEITNEETGEVTQGEQIVDVVRTYGELKETSAGRAAEIRATVANGYKLRGFKYALEPGEIIPVGELIKFPVYLRSQQYCLYPKTAKAQVIFYVMNDNGEVSAHTWTSDNLNTGYQVVLLDTVIDVQAIDGLPTNGWIVGIEVKPYGVVDTDSVTTFVASGGFYDSQMYYAFYFNNYKISYPAPTGLSFDGEKITGLDSETNYIFAPLGADGLEEDRAIEISGVSEYTVPTDKVGLWGVAYDVDGNFSKLSYTVYLRGAYADRADITEITTVNDTYDQVQISGVTGFLKGYFTGNGSWTNYNWGSKYRISTTSTHFSATLNNNIYNAADDAAKETAFNALASKIKGIYVQYALTDAEIVPISEVNTYTYKIARNQGVFSNANHVVRYDAYVADAEGRIRTYTYLHTPITLSNTAATLTVDFEDASANGNWVKALPADGYLVGFKIWPYYGMTDWTTFSTSEYTAGSRIYVDHVSTGYSISLPKADKPEGITVEGNVISGLKDNYVIAPYTILGADTDNAITSDSFSADGTYTLTDEETGLWAVVVPASADNSESDPVLVYSSAPYSVRSAPGEVDASGAILVSKTKESALEWAAPGTFAGGDWYSANDTFKSDWMYDVANAQSLYNADANGDTATAAALRQTTKDVLASISYRYAFTSAEISPIADVVDMTFGRATQNVTMKIANAGGRVELYVMDADGNVTVHTQEIPRYALGSDGNAPASRVTIDVQSIEGLPTEGWLVGYKYYPMSNVIDSDITGKDSSATHYSICVRVPSIKFTDNYYTIVKPKLDTPTGITVEGTTFKGLDSSKTYSVAAYTLAGADADVKTVTGVEEYDIST
ncbi:MAG: hypothetical protein IJ451_01545, partial [Ruminococcus sp.]|nr:hypothetical protein [Ruminococcus sp.]